MRRTAGFHIDREGVWRHRGSVIRRESMVRLFAAMLERRDDRYVLLTPEQVLRVEVDDAPFVIVDMELLERSGDERDIVLVTNVGERHLLGPEHPLYLRRDAARDEVRAYQRIRDGMPALIHRHLFYRLAELARSNEDGVMGIYSGGRFYPLEESEASRGDQNG